MTRVIATSLNGKIELLTNGNYAFWTRPASGTGRSRYTEFAGRTEASALQSLFIRAETRGY